MEQKPASQKAMLVLEIMHFKMKQPCSRMKQHYHI